MKKKSFRADDDKLFAELVVRKAAKKLAAKNWPWSPDYVFRPPGHRGVNRVAAANVPHDVPCTYVLIYSDGITLGVNDFGKLEQARTLPGVIVGEIHNIGRPTAYFKVGDELVKVGDLEVDMPRPHEAPKTTSQTIEELRHWLRRGWG